MLSSVSWNGTEVKMKLVRAMYSIFNAISTDEFHRIATCTLAAEGLGYPPSDS